jgi:hypothetical protein
MTILMMTKLESWFASARAQVAYWGTNVQFLANIGHFFVPYGIIATFPRFKWYLLAGFILYGLVKEYYFDARDEVPKQTFWDNTEDFLGYLSGSIVACFVFRFR